MHTHTIIIDIEPTTTTFQANARTVKRGKHYMLFMPPKSKGGLWKSLLTEKMSLVSPEEKIKEGCSVTFVHTFPYLQKHTNKYIEQYGDCEGYIPKTTRPDCDNLNKITQDVFASIFLEDDALIWDLRVIKRYGENSNLMIYIERR